MMKDINRLIERQDFQNQEDLQAFLDNLRGKPIPSLDFKDLTPQEKAEDLVKKAQRLDP